MGKQERRPEEAEPQLEAKPEVAAKEATEPAGPEAEAKPKWKFQVLADREARWSESRYWRDFAIGHAWIRLIAPEGDYDSWGYWPDLWSGHGVDPKAPWKSVPGKVLHPDEQHVPNAQHTYEIEAEKAQQVTDAANAKESSPGMYNLFSYNCTTFAIEMARTAGVSPPSGTLAGIANPNSIYQGIVKLNANQGLDAMGQRPAESASEGEE